MAIYLNVMFFSKYKGVRYNKNLVKSVTEKSTMVNAKILNKFMENEIDFGKLYCK